MQKCSPPVCLETKKAALGVVRHTVSDIRTLDEPLRIFGCFEDQEIESVDVENGGLHVAKGRALACARAARCTPRSVIADLYFSNVRPSLTNELLDPHSLVAVRYGDPDLPTP